MSEIKNPNAMRAFEIKKNVEEAIKMKQGIHELAEAIGLQATYQQALEQMEQAAISGDKIALSDLNELQGQFSDLSDVDPKFFKKNINMANFGVNSDEGSHAEIIKRKIDIIEQLIDRWKEKE